MLVRIKTVFRGEPLPLPSYAKPGDAGMDVRADVPGALMPGQSVIVPTGLCVAIPPGYEIQVRPRSGLAAKFGISVLNAPGTIDAGYRNEIGVILINHGTGPFHFDRGDRIAQLVLAPVAQAVWAPTTDLDDSDRGLGGFGSSGLK